MLKDSDFPWRQIGKPEKYLRTTQSLIEALLKLPDGSKITVNAVGNLAVLNSDNKQIGFLEIRENPNDLIYELK